VHLSLAYILLHIVHLAWTLFILLGWIWAATRLWHLGVVAVTAASWFVLRIWYGWGYCPFTEWHWQVRFAQGEYPSELSYIEYAIHLFFNWRPDTNLVLFFTVGLFFLCMGLSIGLNWGDQRRR